MPLGNTVRPSKKHVSVRIDVKRRLLDWAITRSGKSVDDLYKNRTICNIRKWLSGGFCYNLCWCRNTAHFATFYTSSQSRTTRVPFDTALSTPVHV